MSGAIYTPFPHKVHFEILLLDVSGAHYIFDGACALQPSPFTLFLSSQISGLFITPFPHFKVHFEILLLDVSGAHSYPFSMVHVLLQPSPFTLFLSSQMAHAPSKMDTHVLLQPSPLRYFCRSQISTTDYLSLRFHILRFTLKYCCWMCLEHIRIHFRWCMCCYNRLHLHYFCHRKFLDYLSLRFHILLKYLLDVSGAHPF